MGITGTPRASSISLTRTEPPFSQSSSIIFKATTMGIPSSSSCMVRYRFLSMLVASTILMIPLGLVWITNSLVTISSLLYGDME